MEREQDTNIDRVDPLELDHRNDFTITFASIRHISTQTLGLDNGFFVYNPPVKTEPCGDIYAYEHHWPVPSQSAPCVQVEEKQQSPPNSPDSTTTGFSKCVSTDQAARHWEHSNSDYMMSLMQHISQQNSVQHVSAHHAQNHARRSGSLHSQNIAHVIHHCAGPLHTPVLPVLQAGPSLSCPTVSSTVQDRYPVDKVYPKPVYSYSCLIAMALKQSADNKLPVSEIYHYMQREFPYFRTAPEGWKNSVRHNLSLNKAFCKLDRDVKRDCSGSFVTVKKGCYWLLNPDKIDAMDREIEVWKIKHPEAIKASMINPEDFWNPPNSGISSPPRHLTKSGRSPADSAPHYHPYSKTRARRSSSNSDSFILPPKERKKEGAGCYIPNCYHGNPGQESSVAMATAEEMVTTTLAEIWEENN